MIMNIISPTDGQSWKNDIILIGGGSGRFFDRQRVLDAHYSFTPIYRSVARYVLKRERPTSPGSIDRIPIEAPSLDLYPELHQPEETEEDSDLKPKSCKSLFRLFFQKLQLSIRSTPSTLDARRGKWESSKPAKFPFKAEKDGEESELD